MKSFHTLRPEQKGSHSADGFSKYIFINKDHDILIQIALPVIWFQAHLKIRQHLIR